MPKWTLNPSFPSFASPKEYQSYDELLKKDLETLETFKKQIDEGSLDVNVERYTSYNPHDAGLLDRVIDNGYFQTARMLIKHGANIPAKFFSESKKSYLRTLKGLLLENITERDNVEAEKSARNFYEYLNSLQIPSYLYYGDSPDNKENQGTNLTGQVDPVALHDQKDQCFIQSKLDAQKNPKAIIINAVTINENLDLINKLDKNGFKIYIYDDYTKSLQDFFIWKSEKYYGFLRKQFLHNGLARNINLDLYNDRGRRNFDILTSDFLKSEAARRLDLSADQIFTIDDKGLNKLQKDIHHIDQSHIDQSPRSRKEEPDTNKIKVNFEIFHRLMKSNGRNDQIEKLLELLPEDNFEIENDFVKTFDSVRAEKAIRKFNHRFGRNVTTKNNSFSSTLHRRAIEGQINSDQSKLQESRIIDFKISVSTGGSESFGNCWRPFSDKLSKINSLPKLEFIDIDDSAMDISMLSKIIEKAPNLKHIFFTQRIHTPHNDRDIIGYGREYKDYDDYQKAMLEIIAPYQCNIEAQKFSGNGYISEYGKDITITDVDIALQEINAMTEDEKRNLSQYTILDIECDISSSQLAEILTLFSNVHNLTINKLSHLRSEEFPDFPIVKNLSQLNVANLEGIELSFLKDKLQRSSACLLEFIGPISSEHKGHDRDDKKQPVVFTNLVSLSDPSRLRGDTGPNFATIKGDIKQSDQKTLYEKQPSFTGADGKEINENICRREIYNNCTIEDGRLKLESDLQSMQDVEGIEFHDSQQSFNRIFQIAGQKLEGKRARNYSVNYKGQVNLEVGDKWEPLPSITYGDKLKALLAVDYGSKITIDINQKFDIKYCQKTGLYYIKKKENPSLSITLDLLIEAELERGEVVEMGRVDQIENSAVKEIISKYQGFSEFGDDFTFNNEDDFITSLNNKKAGACRHRAVAAFLEIKKIEGVDCRIVSNDNHMFIEVKERVGGWIKIDLGGSSITLESDGQIMKTQPARQIIEDASPATRPRVLEAMGAEEISELQQQEIRITLEQKIEAQQKIEEQKREDKFGPFKKLLDSKEKESYRDVIDFNKREIFDSKPGLQTRNILIRAKSEQELINYRRILLQQMRDPANEDVEYFYVNSAEELSLERAYIEIEGKDGDQKAAKKTPQDNPLYKFITSVSYKKKFLIINWDNFSAADITKFNSLIDEDRKLDSSSVQENIKIISLQNTASQNFYNGSDFLGRHQLKKNVNLSQISRQSQELLGQLQIKEYSAVKEAARNHEIAEESSISSAEKVEINLCHYKNWQEILLGRFIVNNQDVKYQEGELIKAIKQVKKDIILINAPWHDREFALFIDRLLIEKKFNFHGQEIDIPDDFIILKQERQLDRSLTHKAVAENEIIINNSNIYQLSRSCSLDEKEGGALVIGEGILESLKNSALQEGAAAQANFFVTGPISEYQLSQIKEEAKRLNIECSFRLAPGITLPGVNNEAAAAEEREEKLVIDESNSKRVIVSDDVDYTVKQIIDQNQEESIPTKVIDISEMNPDDLLFSYQNKTEEGLIRFKEIEGALIALLKKEPKDFNIILKGGFNQGMINQLTRFMINPPATDIADVDFNRVKFVSRSIENLEFSQPLRKANATFAEKIALLQKEFENSADILRKLNEQLEKSSADKAKLGYSYLKSCLIYLKKYPEKSIDQMREGLEKINRAPDQKEQKERQEEQEEHITKENESNAADIADNFDRQRLNSVQEMLSVSPWVFIAGQTGVGKSKFIENVLKKEGEYNVTEFSGSNSKEEFMKKLREWQSQEDEKSKILFIDEANLIGTDYLIFDGLKNNSPAIIIGNKYFELTEKHKIIFAGNPRSYGDRKTPELLARHGGSIIFDKMPPIYIYHRILKPVFEGSALDEGSRLDIVNKILNIYDKISEISDGSKILISARELQMMALAIVSNADQSNHINQLYFIAEQLIPENKKAEFNKWFAQKIGAITDVVISDAERQRIDNEKFILTNSRHQAYNILDNLLKIRQGKISYEGDVVQRKYGGLNG